jgi:hypothetical protein
LPSANGMRIQRSGSLTWPGAFFGW